MENKERETKNLTYLVSTIIHYLSGMAAQRAAFKSAVIALRRPCKVAIAFRGHVVAHALNGLSQVSKVFLT